MFGEGEGLQNEMEGDYTHLLYVNQAVGNSVRLRQKPVPVFVATKP